MKRLFYVIAAAALFLASANVADAQQRVDNKEIFFKGDFFVGIGAGPSVYFGEQDRAMKFHHRLAPAMDVYIGKWIIPCLGVRIAYSGGRAYGVTNADSGYTYSTGEFYQLLLNDAKPTYKQEFNYLGVRGDLLFNITSLALGHNPDRIYDFTFYGGLGINKVYDKLEASMKLDGAKEKDGGVEIESEGTLKFNGKTVFESEIKYMVYADGSIRVKTELERKGFALGKIDIPRFGLNVHLDKSLENVKYYGLGDKENLPDFDAQSTLGVYEAKVSDLNVDYIKPQDNGNHGKTRYASFTDENGKGIEFFNSKNYFSFSAHRYSEETLCNSRHIEDIKDDGIISVNIDGFMRGTGTNSCGPDTLGKYKIDFKKELEFSFWIVPKK